LFTKLETKTNDSVIRPCEEIQLTLPRGGRDLH